MSTLGCALLGLLAREPASGYDLAQTLSDRVGFFWRAQHSQIYPELARLGERGYLTVQQVASTEGPDKKIYSITAGGLDALGQWASEPVEVTGVRDELVLKAYCLWLANPAQAIMVFRTHEQQHAARLAQYQQNRAWLLEQWTADGSRINSPWFGSYIAIERGIGYEQEYAAWCRWVIELLERLGADREDVQGDVQR